MKAWQFIAWAMGARRTRQFLKTRDLCGLDRCGADLG